MVLADYLEHLGRGMRHCHVRLANYLENFRLKVNDQEGEQVSFLMLWQVPQFYRHAAEVEHLFWALESSVVCQEQNWLPRRAAICSPFDIHHR